MKTGRPLGRPPDPRAVCYRVSPGGRRGGPGERVGTASRHGASQSLVWLWLRGDGTAVSISSPPAAVLELTREKGEEASSACTWCDIPGGQGTGVGRIREERNAPQLNL